MCKLVHLLFWHWLITTALATSAELSITGSPQLNKWEENGHKKVYHYNFAKEENLKLKCSFKRTGTMPAEFTLSFYMDGDRQIRQTTAHSESKFSAERKDIFHIEKRSKVITCVAERVGGLPVWPVDGEESYEGEVRLHYRPPAPEQTPVISTQRPALLKDPCVPNPCGSNSICNINNGQVACSCLPDFLGSPPKCRLECTLSTECDRTKSCSNQKCINPCTNACGENAECKVVYHAPICSCPQGFEGNPNVGCLKVVSTTPSQPDLETTSTIPATPAERSDQHPTSTTPSQPDLETTSTIPATPAERLDQYTTIDTDQKVSVDTGTRVSVTLWVVSVLTVAIIIIAALIAAVLKYRAIVRKLESNRIPEHMRSRPPLTLPPEIVYDHVYSHGAGLLRPPLKPVQ